MRNRLISTSDSNAYIVEELQKRVEQVDVEAGLRSLSESLRKLRSLLAWQELIEAEKCNAPQGLDRWIR